jgi:hypothetical protein
MQPYMSDEAAKRLYKFFDKATHIWEYGSGGSTYQACMRPSVKTVHTIESDGGWAEKVRVAVHDAGHGNKLVLKHVDICSRPNHLGLPGAACTFGQAVAYPRALNDCGVKPDLVVVDGRFRVACALHAWNAMDESAVLLIDDYPGRTQYHMLEKHFAKIPGDCDGRLVAFRKITDKPPSAHDIMTHEMCAL